MMKPINPQAPPMVNALIYYPGGYGHFKKIHGDIVVLNSVAKDRNDNGVRYGMPLEQCSYEPGYLETCAPSVSPGRTIGPGCRVVRSDGTYGLIKSVSGEKYWVRWCGDKASQLCDRSQFRVVWYPPIVVKEDD